MGETQIDRVRKYYDATVLDYRTLWTGTKDLAMHFGYFADGTESHEASLLKMNEALSRLVDISRRDRVLDAGCGYGGSAIWLAEHVGCKVVGVNVVPFQVQRANESLAKHDLGDRVCFRVEDYTHTLFPDGMFTVVWALESIVHAVRKGDFVREAFRLLQGGGRIIISEYMLRAGPPLSDDEKNIISPLLQGWAMPGLLTLHEYRELLADSGFGNIKTFDFTENVRPSLRRLGTIAAWGLPLAKVLRVMKAISGEHYGNVEAAYYQWKALNLGLWKYAVVTAEKH